MPAKNRLRKRALIDLTNRARGGIFLYLITWVAIGVTYELSSLAPYFFYFNFLVFSFFMILRAAHYYLVKRNPDFQVCFMTNCLIVLILAGGLHWGLIVAWIVSYESYQEIRNLILVVTPAFAIGGAVALSISNTIRIIYPTLVYLPGMLVLLLAGDSRDFLIPLLAFFSLIYVYITTSNIHSDYWAAIKDYLKVEKRADRMEVVSNTDPLTKVKNRMYFDRRFQEEWKRSTRSDSPLSILMLDLDRFKQINDSYGHSFGDDYLKVVANTLSAEIHREGDCMARYGGEEFVFLLPDTDADNACLVASRLLKSISQAELEFEGKRINITCSIGGSTIVPDHKISLGHLLKKADEALYQAKNNGRNQYCFSS